VKITNKIQKLINVFKGFEKYTLLAIVGLIVIYSVNYIGVEFFKIKPQITYFVATGINLITAYFGNAWIFGSKTTQKNLFKFIINSIIFFILNNYLFHIFISLLKIHYLIAIAINFIIFPVAKFLSYKKFVFSKKNA